MRALVIVPSLLTAAFGAWHLFVPTLWGWYAYLPPEASELAIAVRALNALFSLCLLMLGAGNVVLVLRLPREPFAFLLALASSTLLWAARVALQLAYPQGTQVRGLAPAMLAVFCATLAAFAFALGLHWRRGEWRPASIR